MPMDESPVSHEDAAASDTVDRDTGGMSDIWSSIGPGRRANEIEGPPTIRPIDDPGSADTRNRTPMTPPTPNFDPTGTPTDRASEAPTSTSDAIRDELRIGVRMLEALELQLKRAEELITAQSEVTRRAELANERLEANLAQTAVAPGSASNAAPSTDETLAATATVELRQVLDHASELRRDFHGDLSAVAKATAALMEAVEIAAGTEKTLRNTIGEAERTPPVAANPGIGAAAESIGEVLRRLAREFDAAADASVVVPTPAAPATATATAPEPFDATPPPPIGSIDPHERRRVGTLEITRPLEFDLTESGDRNATESEPTRR